MGPKTVFHRGDVVHAALGIVRDKGLGVLSARQVAEALGASVAPVYSHFSNMDILRREVLEMVKESLLLQTKKQYTENAFLNMGIGIVMFSQDYPNLFRALFLDNACNNQIIDEIMAELESAMDHSGQFVDLSQAGRHDLLRRMWTYTHGLATLVCIGYVTHVTWEKAAELLYDTGAALVEWTASREAKLCEGDA